jgi:hypothetical protein
MDNQHRQIKGYRELNEMEIAMMNKIKETGVILDSLMADLQNSAAREAGTTADPRWLAIGKTHLQEGLMALTRAIARPELFVLLLTLFLGSCRLLGQTADPYPAAIAELNAAQARYLALDGSRDATPAALGEAQTAYWSAVTAALRAADEALQPAHYRHDGEYALPDLRATPGVANPSCIADRSGKQHMVSVEAHGKSVTLEENICAKDFRTGPIRATITNFAKLKREACDAYGVTKCDASVEGDHDMSIEICGKPDDVRNIWPQPMDQARVKDHQVEDQLPKLICAGKIGLADAQKCMTGDWVKCGQRIKELEGK